MPSESPAAAATSAVDRPAAIAAAALLSGVAILVFNAMPLILGAAADSLGLSNQRLGFLASAYLAGHALMTVLLIFWVRHVSWRVAIVGAAVFQGVAFAVSSQVGGFSGLAIALFLAGLAGGALFGIAITCQADSSEPDRNMGLGTFVQVVLPAAVVLVLPSLVLEPWGFGGVMWMLAGFALIAGALSIWMPAAGGRADESSTGAAADQTGSGSSRTAAWTMLAGAFVFITGNAALWAYVERVGDAAGLDSEFMGQALSGALVSGGLGSLVPVILGQRFGRWPVVTVAILVQVAAVATLARAASESAFAIGGALFMFGWTVAVIYQLAGAADLSARAAATIPAVLGIASAAGPALAGSILGDAGFARLFVLTTATLAASWAIFSWASRRLALARAA